jgi:NAD(P)-dependent dehydrogenase (short-subunit alcohol dehydrogenase family)
MPTVMIIGASRGIGLELARQYAAADWCVHATTRTPDRPGPLGAVTGDITLHPLEVRDAVQVRALVEAMSHTAIDVLIHNAGVLGPPYTAADMMAINADAPIMITRALLETVVRSTRRTIVLMSSQVGARHGTTRSLGPYGDSKAALNDRFRALAPEWGRQGCVAVVLHPGWVRTDMGGPGAPLTPRESVTAIRAFIARLTLEEHGGFWNWDGRRHAW